jgi:hypothetical protein
MDTPHSIEKEFCMSDLTKDQQVTLIFTHVLKLTANLRFDEEMFLGLILNLCNTYLVKATREQVYKEDCERISNDLFRLIYKSMYEQSKDLFKDKKRVLYTEEEIERET